MLNIQHALFASDSKGKSLFVFIVFFFFILSFLHTRIVHIDLLPNVIKLSAY